MTKKDFKYLLETTAVLEEKLKDSFSGKTVKVWIRWVPWYVGMVEIWARVGNVFKYITLDPEYKASEWYLYDILVGKIKEAADE